MKRKNTLEELDAPVREKEELNKNITNEDILNEIKEAKNQIISSFNRVQKSNVTMERFEDTEHEKEDDVKHKMSKARTKFEVANVDTELEYN